MQNVHASATSAFAVTPSDTDEQPAYKSIYVGGGGDITLSWDGGKTNVLFTALPSGAVLNATSARIMATGTTATAMVGMNW